MGWRFSALFMCTMRGHENRNDAWTTRSYRIDELVDDLVIVENKSVDEVHPIHMAQLLTYVKLKNIKLGFLINWNVKLIKNGMQRVVNGLEEPSKRAGFIKKP